MQLGDIPKDLDIQLVRPPTNCPSYHRLLTLLGVQAADPAHVAELIWTRHSRSYGRFGSQSTGIPLHAQFLFQHAPRSGRTSPFYVLTSEGIPESAQNVYMNPDSSPDSPLQRFITLGGVKVLSNRYLTQFDEENRVAWIDWLQKDLGVFKAPRIHADGTLSPEFRQFIKRADTETFLAVLREYWSHLQGALYLGYQELKGATVTCEDGSQRTLDSTFVKRPELEKMDDLPFLPLADPAHSSWDFLAKLGVSLSADSLGYLKLLQQLRQKDVLPKKKDVENLYRSLAARFNDEHAAKIR